MLAMRRGETPLEYWISLWPTAPLFGVPWRFEALSPLPFFRPSQVFAQMAGATAQEAARVVEERASTATRIVEEATKAVVEAEPAAAAEAATEAEPIAAPAEAATEAEPDQAPAEEAAKAKPAEASGDEAEGAGPRKPTGLFRKPPAEVDDLKRIKGVGPKLEAMLNEMGVYRLDQIAGFSEAELAWVDANLTAFRGRPLRDDWVAQARALL